MSRRLIFDGQVFQTPALHRGMGKYSMELISALCKLNESGIYWHEIIVILSSRLNIDEPKKLISIKNPTVKVEILNLEPNDINNENIAFSNRKVIDSYIDSLDQAQTDFIILSLLQGEICPVFPSIGAVTKSVIYYDLIPLIFHDVYLTNPVTRREYLSKFSELLLADIYLGISETTCNDLALYLGIDKERIVNIDGGPIEHGTVVKKYEIPRPFILMPTGNDLRKNNEGGIMGFAKFNAKHNNRYTLVITSYFKDFEIEQLSTKATNVIFTGNISGEELNYLYQESEALLFPTTYEGLGLPILEALEKKKPVACSDIPVFRELSRTAFNFFNPKSTQEIAEALSYAVSEASKVDRNEYMRVIKKYTWQHVAKKVAESLNKAHTYKIHPDGGLVAIFGIDPSSDSSPAKSMQENYAELKRVFDVVFYLQEYNPTAEKRINYLAYAARTRMFKSKIFIEEDKYDAIIYHIDNSPEFAQILLIALAIPGIVILHSLELDRTWESLYAKEIISSGRFELEKEIDRRFGIKNTKFLVSTLRNQKAIIVQSETEKVVIDKLLESVQSSVPVYVIHMPTSSLVYPDILPTNRVENNSDLLKLVTEAPRDYDYYERLSRIEKANYLGSATHVPLPILEALKFGVRPITGRGGVGLPERCNRKNDVEPTELIQYVSQEHSHVKFSEELKEIIMLLRDA